MQDPETQKTLRFTDPKDMASALIYAHKTEAAQQALKKDRHAIRGISATDPKTDFLRLIENLRKEIRSLKEHKNGRDGRIRFWDCGEDGQVQKNCPMPKDGHNNGRKPHF